MPNQIKQLYEFGPFRLDPESSRLTRDGDVVSLPPKAIEALLVLVRNAGKALDREMLLEAVWPDSIVEDANLTVAISQLRRAFSKYQDRTEYIETIARVGYRFLPEVRELQEQLMPLKVERHTVSRTVIEEEISKDDIGSENIESRPMVTQSASRSIPELFGLYKRQLLLATLCLVVIIGVFAYFRTRERPVVNSAKSAGELTSIAVLTPQATDAEAETASLSLGIADALITRLGKHHSLVVRPSRAIPQFVAKQQDSVTLGRSLKVDTVLEGSIQRDAGRVRVTLRLLSTDSGKQLWTESFEETDNDIFELQDLIAEQVAAAIKLDLSGPEKELPSNHLTSNPDAYRAYLNGKYYWEKRGIRATNAIQHFQETIRLDPKFAEPYVGLANYYAINAKWPEAAALVEKALELDDRLAEAHATVAFIEMFHHWDWPAAERALDRAIELNPNSANAYHWKGVYFSIHGRLDEARVHMERALELDPLSVIVIADIGMLYYFGRHYDKALEYVNRALAFDSGSDIANTYRANIREAQRRESNSEATKVELKNVEDPRSYIGKVTSLGMSLLYLQRGDREESLIWLERSFQKRDLILAFIKVDPRFDPLRNEPRFQAIIAGMGL